MAAGLVLTAGWPTLECRLTMGLVAKFAIFRRIGLSAGGEKCAFDPPRRRILFYIAFAASNLLRDWLCIMDEGIAPKMAIDTLCSKLSGIGLSPK